LRPLALEHSLDLPDSVARPALCGIGLNWATLTDRH